MPHVNRQRMILIIQEPLKDYFLDFVSSMLLFKKEESLDL